MGLSFSINSNYLTTNPDEKLAYLQQQIQISYDLKEMENEILEQGLLRELEKNFILQQIDFSWMEHLEKITFPTIQFDGEHMGKKIH